MTTVADDATRPEADPPVRLLDVRHESSAVFAAEATVPCPCSTTGV